MIYFTSDLHLGHDNAIHFNGRHFADVDEMNRVLIDNINAVAAQDDELWIVGDFSYKTNKEQVAQFRENIECRNVHLVYGNHDKEYDNQHIFQSVQYYKELKTEYGRLILFHYPMLEWNSSHYGSIHLHGHIHSTGEYNEANLQKLYTDRFLDGHTPKRKDLHQRIYDVGVDANNYRPISIEEIARLMNLEPVKKAKNSVPQKPEKTRAAERSEE